jgi:hypothetical protein
LGQLNKEKLIEIMPLKEINQKKTKKIETQTQKILILGILKRSNYLAMPLKII